MNAKEFAQEFISELKDNCISVDTLPNNGIKIDETYIEKQREKYDSLLKSGIFDKAHSELY